MSFTIAQLTGHRALVRGTDTFGTVGECVVSSEEWEFVKRHLAMHDAVALAVVRGDYDAGVLKSAIGMKYAHLGLTTLAETPPLPSLALVANSTRVSAETVDRLRTALVEADSAVRASWGDNIRHGAVLATDKDYDPVRKLLRGQRRIPPKGNF